MFDDLDDTCWNCGGEGVVYDCLSDYACIDPEGGCDLCERRCDVCRPNTPNASVDTHPGRGGDEAQTSAPFMGGATRSEAKGDAQ